MHFRYSKPRKVELPASVELITPKPACGIGALSGSGQVDRYGRRSQLRKSVAEDQELRPEQPWPASLRITKQRSHTRIQGSR